MKLLIKVAIAIILLLIIGIIGFYFSINWIVEKGVESYGPKITQTDVKLKKSSISLLTGNGKLKGIFIGNPKGFQTDSAFELDEVKVAMNISSIFDDKIIIDEILINAPEVTYEMKGKTNNIKAILNNIQSFAAKSKAEKGRAEEKTAEKAEKNGERKMQINNFIMKNGKVNMSATTLKGQKLTFTLPDIHLKDIGKEGEGKSTSEVFEDVFKVVNKNIAIAVSGTVKETAEEAKKTVDRIKGLFDKDE